MDIFIIFILCSVLFSFLAYFFYRISKFLSSRIAWLNWLLIKFRQVEFLQATFFLVFIFVFLGFNWVLSINESQKEEMRQITLRNQETLNNLAAANKEMLALKEEKRFAFQPVQAPAVKTEPEEKIQEESQNEIVLAVEKMEQAEEADEQTFSVKTETKNEVEIDLAKFKAQIDALKLGIEAAKAQVSAQITPVSAADVGISEAVATMN